MALSICLNPLPCQGGAEGWLRAQCHSACGLSLWWVHSASGRKELMAAGIMQWRPRRLFSSPALLFLPQLPFKRGASQIRHSCTFQSDAFECDVSSAHALAPMREQNRGFVSLRSLPSPGPRTCPAGGKVVRIYNRLSGLQLQCVRLVKTHVFHHLR